MQFKIKKQSEKSRARTGIIKTPHGSINTPYFIPVATAATVRGLNQEDMKSINAEVLLANTYHLHLKPGDKIIKKLGGLHKFMNWDMPLFTDSGGFQAFSLGYGMEHNINKLGNIFPENKKALEKKENLAKIDDEGVTFKDPKSGKTVHINPKKSIKIQQNLGADIILAFDECTSPLSSYEYTRKAMERTHKWALQSLKNHKRKAKLTKQSIYGIVQGGEHKDLREESAKFISSLDFDGIAIGGSLGRSKKDMHKILGWVIPLLPKNKPRHLLGIGNIDDVFECVEKGIDTFDCVAPTRTARRGSLFISPKSGGNLKNKFRINIKNSKYRLDKKPVDKDCNCLACKNYSRAYLNHLYKSQELAYYRLASLHNVSFMLRLMEEIRDSINNSYFEKLKREWLR
ncbi:tRNA guanosine(34) transglycosylase Tgt [Candidatus Woesearchaeota archaeon]|nr:tRNA guanosine(34) transglycosylase Tgt [Candidatus Woesearchaeota archaeon]